MQAIRTLRAQSRAASPAPDQTLKPVSPTLTFVEDAHNQTNHTTTKTTVSGLSRIQTLAKLRRPSTPSATATSTSQPAVGAAPPVAATLVQDGGYLSALGLKLSEATSRALAPVSGSASAADCLKGRKPLPAGRGRALGLLISSELVAARENPNLERAILRLLPRSLSVLVATVTSQLTPLLSAPGYVPTSCTTTQLDASTLHGLALAGFCAELLDTLFTPHSLDMKSADLGALKATIENVVLRLTSPLFGAVQHELVACLDGASKPAVYKKPGAPHPALQQFQALAPHAGKALRRYNLTGCGSICKTTESQLASLVIAVSWSGMLALVCRPASIHLHPSPSTSPSGIPGSPGKKGSPALPALSSLPGKTSTSGKTPPTTPKNPLRLLPTGGGSGGSPNAFSLVGLPAVLSSRPPSPPADANDAPLVLDFRAFVDVLEREECFPRPAADTLAGEAVEEALARVRAVRTWVMINFATATAPASATTITITTHAMEVREIVDLPGEEDDVPFLLALELVLRHRLGVDAGAAGFLGMGEEAYRRRCLTGFGRADEWAAVVGSAVREGLDTYTGMGATDSGKEKGCVREWIVRRGA